MLTPTSAPSRALRLLVSVLLLTGCGATETTANPIIPRIPVARVDVSPATVGPLAPAGTAVLTASVRAADGSALADRAVTWTSAAPAVATVSGTGTVTAVGPGTTTVTATSEGVSGSATVTVRLPVARVVVSPAAVVLPRGGTQPLTVRTEAAGGTVLTDRPVVWTTTNPAVATVSNAGVVTAVGLGEATISANSEGITGSTSVSVRIPVAQLQISPASLGPLAPSETATLTAQTMAADGSLLGGRTVTWHSGSPAVATVTAGGQITAISEGSTTITATSEGVSAGIAVTVRIPVARVVVSPSALSIPIGRTTVLAAVAKAASGADLANRTVTWQSSNPTVAVVSATGVVSALTPGVTTVTAVSEGRAGQAVITVTQTAAPVTQIELDAATTSLPAGATRLLSAVLRDANGAILGGRTITWRSSNAAIATVSGTGIVSGLVPGVAAITAECEGKTATTDVLVTVPGFNPATGLMAYYPFNGNATDASGNGLNATVRGATLTPDRFGMAARAYGFGKGQDIIVPGTESRNYLPVTVSLWYYLDVEMNVSQNMFSKYASGSYNGLQIIVSGRGADRNVITPWYISSIDNRVLGDYGDDPFFLSPRRVGQWYHFAFVVDQQGGRLYSDGVLIDSHPWTGTASPMTNQYQWKIGGNYEQGLPTEFFEGRIDEVRIYNRALSSGEILTLFALERQP